MVDPDHVVLLDSLDLLVLVVLEVDQDSLDLLDPLDLVDLQVDQEPAGNLDLLDLMAAEDLLVSGNSCYGCLLLLFLNFKINFQFYIQFVE